MIGDVDGVQPLVVGGAAAAVDRVRGQRAGVGAEALDGGGDRRDGVGQRPRRRRRAAGQLSTKYGKVEDRVAGLTIGGDDYIVKPFSLSEVVARIRAVLRRTGHAAAQPHQLLAYGDLEIDEAAHEVRRGGRLIDLSPTEFRLLHYLVENAETVVSKAQILDTVWQYDFGGDANVVESYISYLRRKVDTVEPHLIQTVRGVGYVIRQPRP